MILKLCDRHKFIHDIKPIHGESEKNVDEFTQEMIEFIYSHQSKTLNP